MAFFDDIKQFLQGRVSPAYPSAPEPAEAEMLRSVQTIKQGYEQLVRVRGDVGDSAVLVSDIPVLLDMLLDGNISIVVDRDASQHVTRCTVALSVVDRTYEFLVSTDDAGRVLAAEGKLL